MRNFLMAAVAVAALASGSAAMADDTFGGQPAQAGVNSYLDQQATNSEFADPTAPNSIHSHGHP